MAARNYFQLQLQPRSLHGIIFQFRLQPRSRYGKTVSNDNIRLHTIAHKNMTKQKRTRNETEHHIMQLAWNNKIRFVAYFVGLCAIGQCTSPLLRCVAAAVALRGGGGDCVCWLCELVVCVLCVVCESWWCWCSWDCLSLCVCLCLRIYEYR